MPKDIQIKFKGGMDRRSDADPSAPYELHNARLEAYGGVRALRSPETMVDPSNADPDDKAEPEGAPPWVRWNGNWLSRFDADSVEIMQAQDKFNNSLFVTGIDSYDYSINGTVTSSPHYNVLEHDGENFGQLQNPPAIRSVDLTQLFYKNQNAENRLDEKNGWERLSAPTASGEEAPDESSKVGLEVGDGASYLLIPINERQEAGPWAYFSVAVQLADMPDGFDHSSYFQPGIEVKTNGYTSQVEVYRTRQWQDITTHSNYYGTKPIPPGDLSYYKIGQVGTSSPTADGDFEGGNENPGGSGTKTVNFGDFWRIPNQVASSDDEENVVMPSQTLDRDMNAWAYENVNLEASTASQYTFKHDFGPGKYMGANTLFMDGRERMIAGGVKWPTKPPQFAMVVKENGNLDAPMGFTNEYQPTQSDTIHSAYVSEDRILHCWPVWQGEQALHLYTDQTDPGEISRFTVQGTGLYDKITYHDIDNPWNSDSLDINFNLSDTNQQEFVYEPDVALISEQFRPLEMSLEQQFTVPRDQEIRAIEPARLSEEESIASYSFYVLTNDGVYVVNRQNENAQLRTVSRVGVQKYRVDFQSGPRPEYEYPLVAPTKYGTAYIGTDDRVYVLNGRQFETIDNEVPNLWWSDYGEPALANEDFQAIYNEYSDVWTEQTDGGSVEYESLTPYDIAYDEDHNELYVVTYNNVWIFDFERGAWVGNYNLGGATSVQRLGYHNKVMLHRYVPDGSGGVEDKYQLLNENGDPIQDNALVTTPILRSPGETKMRGLAADYDPLFKEATANWTDGSTTINLSSGDTFVDRDEYSTVYVVGGAEGGKDFTSLIENVVGPGEAEVADPLGPAASGQTIRWYPAARVRQEATGDYYSTFDSGGDPVRRTEKNYLIRPRRQKFPRVNGSGHVIRLEKFRAFKSLRLTIDQFTTP